MATLQKIFKSCVWVCLFACLRVCLLGSGYQLSLGRFSASAVPMGDVIPNHFEQRYLIIIPEFQELYPFPSL